MNRALIYVEGRLKCSACLSVARHPGEYLCRGCMSHNMLFNHSRPEAMQGRAVPIFTSWSTKVREP